VRGALVEWLTVAPGDVVVGDADGVIVVPQGLVEEVTAKVVEWAASDSGARGDIVGGMLLLDALKKYGHL
jgi:regulator of RNase E activity RraA